MIRIRETVVNVTNNADVENMGIVGKPFTIVGISRPGDKDNGSEGNLFQIVVDETEYTVFEDEIFDTTLDN